MDAFVPEVAPPPLLECRDLTKRYGATVALDRFTVSLPAGRIVGLLGPNGSGKTTLLKMIAGVAHPTAGDIRVAGYEVGPESKALVSYLPERPYFSRSMRVREMIAYFADFYEDFDAALARDMLARLGVPEDAPTSALSKGTVEKVQLTLVMARHAALYLLVLSEPPFIASTKKVVYMFVRDYYMKTEEIDYYLPPHSITLSSVRISPPIPYSVEYGIVLSS